MKEEQKDKVEVFMKLYEDFKNACKKEGIVPVPAIQYGPTGIVAYVDFTEYEAVKEEE